MKNYLNLKLNCDKANEEHLPFLLKAHPEYTPYIPLHFFTNTLYSYPFKKDVPCVEDTSIRISKANPRLSRIFHINNDKIYEMGLNFYASSTFVLKENNLVFGVFVKSRYVLDIFDRYFNFLTNESLAWKYYKNKNFFDNIHVHRDVQLHLSYEYFQQHIIGSDLKENLVLFIDKTNRDLLARHFSYADQKLELYKEYVPRVIEDEDQQYFLSEGFVELEPPVFEEIDGAEKLLLEAL